MISLSRVRSILRKELRHIFRDPFTLGMALGLPVILLVAFGYIIDLNYGDIRLVLQDRDNTRISREFARSFSSSGYFTLLPHNPAESASALLARGAAAGSLEIKKDFGRNIKSGRTGEAQLLIDGTDNSKAGVALSYVSGILAADQTKFAAAPLPPSPQLRTRFLFNPELSSRWFIVPGLTCIIIGLLCVLMTALTVAREWENGSMEMLLSTPVHPLEIVLGKLTPYLFLGLLAALLVYITARLVFGVPFEGSHLLYWPSCMLFITAALSQGLLISVITRQQQIAMQLSMISGLLPAMLLSGFIFPVESMPAFFRYFTMILPPRWFMEINRGIFLKGSSLTELAVPLCALAALDLLLITAAVKKFKTDVEP